MIRPTSTGSRSSTHMTSHATSPRPPPARTPRQSDQPSPSSTRFGSSPDKVDPNKFIAPQDPLSNFRADAGRNFAQSRSPPAPTTSDEDMMGIEDITASQWEACPPGREEKERSGSVDSLEMEERYRRSTRMAPVFMKKRKEAESDGKGESTSPLKL